MFLSDLVFLEDGNPDHVKEYGEGVINFEKRRMVAAVINQIQRLQQVSHWICAFCWLFICLSPMIVPLKILDFFVFSPGSIRFGTSG
jgi:hypothetical protein